MKRLFCVIAVVLMVFAFVLPISAEETECLHDKYPGAIPVGAVIKTKPIDWQKHACYYVCDTCGEDITFFTNDHYIHEYDVRCECGITRNEIALGKAEQDAAEEEIAPCKHEQTEYRYEQHASTTEAPSVHIKFTFCLSCEQYIESAVEAHEASGNMVCINCLQEGVVVTPPIEEPPSEEPPEENVAPPTTDENNEEDADERIADIIVAWLEEHFADLNDEEGVDATITDTIVSLAKEWADEISLIFAVIFFCFKMASKIKRLTSTVKTLNNNSVEIAEKSNTNAQEAAAIAKDFVDSANAILAEVRTDAEDKHKLEEKLAEATRFINTAKLATVELANELAELLVLANIPNAKKEELYSRHRAAVNAIAAAEETEVKLNAENDKEA